MDHLLKLQWTLGFTQAYQDYQNLSYQPHPCFLMLIVIL